MATATSSRPVQATAKQRNWLEEIKREAESKPTAMVIYGPPGIGKTSIAASAPSPVFLIDDQEDGINTLKSSKLIPGDVPVLPAAKTWEDVLGQLDALANGDHGFKYLCIDTLGGLERLCHEYVCNRDFNGDWGEKGFTSYAKGYEVSLPEWRGMLNRLDRLRTDCSMGVIALAHSIVRPYKNPEGEDYDRFICDMHHKTWAVTHKWADMVLFANYYVEVDKGRSGRERAKGKGGQSRFFNTEHHAAFDAKNRHGLPAEIEMGDSGKEAWANLVSEIKAARKDG